MTTSLLVALLFLVALGGALVFVIVRKGRAERSVGEIETHRRSRDKTTDDTGNDRR